MKKITLRPTKEIPVKHKHHWIFSGAIIGGDVNKKNGNSNATNALSDLSSADIVRVYSYDGEFLGHGYFNTRSIIQVRMINFEDRDPMESIAEYIHNALKLRKTLFNDELTNTYRVVNGEGDYISGLIVDRYNDILVLQISTVFMDKIKDFIVKELLKSCKELGVNIRTIYEKSTMSARTKDGLPLFEGVLSGENNLQTEVLENGIKFFVDIKVSQKTGLFLDMREMRNLIGQVSNGKRVLNCFSYTGGFSLYAARGGAIQVDSLDVDPDAVTAAKKNFEINSFNCESNFYSEDAFKFLHNNDLSNYDLIILDPPAFAKKKEDLDSAKKGYGQINRTTMRNMKSGSLLLTCSCSYHLPKEDFEKIVSKAAVDSGKKVRILTKHRLAQDHPINAFHTEVDYLKSLLLFIE